MEKGGGGCEVSAAPVISLVRLLSLIGTAAKKLWSMLHVFSKTILESSVNNPCNEFGQRYNH